ncbi:MFS transporter [Georgenia daeguensis]|uniref:Major facilitator superfamily (MFS) profile domain-containing protein n=1 Tax=Georgenia daeguensis TaxID=908355 RepID=A0ABP8EUZ2_9MICO
MVGATTSVRGPARAARAGTGASLLVILAGMAGALHVWKLAPALPALSEDLGLSLVQGGFLLAVVQVAGMLLGVPVGMAGDRIGLRRALLLGLTLLTAGSAAGIGSAGYWPLLTSRVVEGVGFMLVSICAPALVRRTAPPARVALLTGVWGCHMPLAAVLSLLVGGQLEWRAWWGAAALFSGLMAAAVLVAVEPDPASATPGGAAGRLRATLRARGPLLVALIFLLYTAQWNGIVQFLPTMYADAGRDVGSAAALGALVAGVNAVGNLGAGAALHRGARPPVLWVTGFAAMGLAAVVAFGVAPLLGPDVELGVRYGAVLVFSAVGGVVPTTVVAGLMRTAPSAAAMGTALGMGQQLNALGQFAGPPVVAAVAQGTGTWDLTWTVTAAFAACGIAVASQVARRAPSVLRG